MSFTITEYRVLYMTGAEMDHVRYLIATEFGERYRHHPQLTNYIVAKLVQEAHGKKSELFRLIREMQLDMEDTAGGMRFRPLPVDPDGRE